MVENLIIALVLILFIVLLVCGQYISTILLFCGTVGLFLLGGMERLNGFLQSEPFNQVTTYSLTTIPLYILMAQFIIEAGIIRDFYNLTYKLSRGKSSLLGVFTILLGGFLGAVSGSGTATSAALGQVAVPELKRRGYTDKLAAAIAASSGSLSAIIPPSVILIMYGVITQTSIGQLFAAAMIPGILTMIVFCGVAIYLLRKSKKETSGSFEESSVSDDTPIKQYVIISVAGLIIIISIFGGIYTGFFTPTEAGAVGAFISFIVALLLGKVSIKFMKSSIVETLKVTVMAMLLVIGASIFGRFVSMSLIPRKLIVALEPLMEYPILILIIVCLLFFVLFMFMEGIAVLLMTLPVVLPIIEAINVDPIWFGVMVSLICTLGFLTPPVGISVYTVGAVTKIPIEKIFGSTMIYATVAFIIVGAIMIMFPSVATWLPNSMN